MSYHLYHRTIVPSYVVLSERRTTVRHYHRNILPSYSRTIVTIGPSDYPIVPSYQCTVVPSCIPSFILPPYQRIAVPTCRRTIVNTVFHPTVVSSYRHLAVLTYRRTIAPSKYCRITHHTTLLSYLRSMMQKEKTSALKKT
jgi:hypothetical protein